LEKICGKIYGEIFGDGWVIHTELHGSRVSHGSCPLIYGGVYGYGVENLSVISWETVSV